MADDGTSSSDESIDVTSKKFDPMKALYSSKLIIPISSAPTYDNLSKFESVLKGTQAKINVKPKELEGGESSKRRFLPHQEPVTSKSREKLTGVNNERNVLGKMKNAFGPLSVLVECMETKTRIKNFHQEWTTAFLSPLAHALRVPTRNSSRQITRQSANSREPLAVYTRSARGIRGHVEAYVAAFDKHWNLGLEDCLEVWTRKVKRKAPALGGPRELKFDVRDEDVPKVVVKESNGKWETLERHVPQMLMRGEQIAIIVKIN